MKENHKNTSDEPPFGFLNLIRYVPKYQRSLLVTHVMVNDPTKGYGISIARMLDAAEQSSQEKASA